MQHSIKRNYRNYGLDGNDEPTIVSDVFTYYNRCNKYFGRSLFFEKSKKYFDFSFRGEPHKRKVVLWVSRQGMRHLFCGLRYPYKIAKMFFFWFWKSARKRLIPQSIK